MKQNKCLSIWYFWFFASISTYYAYFGLYLQKIGISATGIAGLMSVAQLMRLFAPFFWGWLADRSGKRVRIMCFSTVGVLIFFPTVFLAKNFISLLAVLIVMHFFWSASLPLAEALTLGHLVNHPDRYGRIRVWGSVGFVVSVVVVGFLLDMMVIDALIWITWTLILITVLSGSLLTETKVETSHTEQSIGPLLRQHKVVVLLIAGLFMTAAHGTFNIFYTIYLVDHGYDKTVAGLLWGIGAMAEIGFFLFMPYIAASMSMRFVLLSCFALAAVRFSLIGWTADYLSLLVLAQVLQGISFGVHHAATMAALNRWFSNDKQARVQALYGCMAYGIGGLSGALLAGVLWNTAGPSMAFSTSAALALIGFSLVWFGIPADQDSSIR